jgi:hypothetical protein
MSNQEKNPFHSYAKYSTMAFQMGIILFGSAYGGVKLDEYLVNKFPLFTLIFTLSGLALAMYLILKDLTKK